MANKLREWKTKGKRCTKCFIPKPRTPEFWHYLPRSADGLAYRCKTCIRDDDRKRHYGVEIDYYELVTHCQICDSEFGVSQSITGKCIDHDHSNNKVRGVICSSCNKTLGYARDNIETLASCIAYLEKYQNEQ